MTADEVAARVQAQLGGLGGVPPGVAADLARRYAEDRDHDLSLGVDRALACGRAAPALAAYAAMLARPGGGSAASDRRGR